jgi:L-2-hydroxycarboxylate dehydrogenase (NAD+)
MSKSITSIVFPDQISPAVTCNLQPETFGDSVLRYALSRLEREVPETTYWIPCDLLEAFIVDVFKGVGVPDEDARTCAKVLIAADKRGIDSHGVGRMKPIYYDRIVRGGIQHPVTQFEVVRDYKATAVIDGHHGMGMVIAKRCMQMAIEKARVHGLGMVVARNSTHYGYAAHYALMAVAAKMIGVTGTNARPSIAPTHGVENMMGTNPLVFGFPTDEEFPFTNDYATSVIQRGKIEQYVREHKSCPEGLVINWDGKTETDPKKILDNLIKGRSAFTPVGGLSEETGGHKGYGFATVVEILSAALQQGAYLKQLSGADEQDRPVPYALGHFFLAIDIECFTGIETFKKITGNILRGLRASQKAPGADRIYTCGEKEYLAWQERSTKGIPVDPVVQAQLCAMRDDLRLPYSFSFEKK